MSKPTQVPGIPRTPVSVDAETRRYLEALSEALQIRLGLRGDPIDRAITLRELIDSGLAVSLKATPFDPNNLNGGNLGFGVNEIIDTATPPAPTNFEANGAYSQVNLSWDYPRYLNHSFSEIYGHDSDVIGDAQLIGVSTGRVYIDPVGSGVSRYYWIRHVSQSSVLGPWNSGTGTLGETAVDVTYILDLLTGAVTDSQLSQSLSSAIGDNAAAATSAAAAAASEAAAITAQVAALLAQSNAETAESNAEIAETNAETAQSNAVTAQNAASSSASGAAGSASSATASATAAASSQTAAGNSATAASTSATSAATYATNAGNSATASQTSRLAADTSKTNAAASASAAATSASYASASESAAGTSASAASSSATNAASSASNASTYSATAASAATNAAGSASAAASTVNGLTARLDNAGGTGVTVEQAYSVNASDIGDLEGQYTVKIDTNGAVAGFGLASTATSSGNITSEFIVNADRFAIMRGGSNTTAATVPFVVQAAQTTINGETVPAGVYMADAFIKNGSIESAKIGTLNADKINAGFISAARINVNTVDASKLILDNSTITSQTLNGVPTVVIKNLGVQTAHIGNAQITTAKIGDLQVNTLKIADQAVTFPVSNITVADQTLTQGGGYQTVQSITHAATGAPIEIAVGFRARSQTGSTGRLAIFGIFRGSTQIFNSGHFYIPGTNGAVQSFLFSETPSSGTYTYTLKVFPTALGSSNLLVSNAYLRTLETKK